MDVSGKAGHAMTNPCLADLPLWRTTDPATSKGAGQQVADGLGTIQRAVLEAYEARGPMSARQAEQLVELAAYGFSTVRKRVSELAAKGYLIAAGTETASGRTPATVYRRAA